MKRTWKAALKSRFEWLRNKVSHASIGTKIFSLIVILVLFLVALVPVMRWAAVKQKAQVWAGKAEYVIPLLAEGTKSRQELSASSAWLESYISCSDQQALLLIYSDENAYYLLCKSTEDSDEGYVFEVRREFGLVSVRFPSAGGQQ